MIIPNHRYRPKVAPHLRKGHVNINQHISDALDRNLAKPPQPVTTLAQMSPEKQKEMARLYPPPKQR